MVTRSPWHRHNYNGALEFALLSRCILFVLKTSKLRNSASDTVPSSSLSRNLKITIQGPKYNRLFRTMSIHSCSSISPLPSSSRAAQASLRKSKSGSSSSPAKERSRNSTNSMTDWRISFQRLFMTPHSPIETSPSPPGSKYLKTFAIRCFSFGPWNLWHLSFFTKPSSNSRRVMEPLPPGPSMILKGVKMSSYRETRNSSSSSTSSGASDKAAHHITSSSGTSHFQKP
mmetsp:Transcript_41886/g.89247  ORF Transcript_41886/g.89247 Transcript_41886/m.89247 type:complete len:229 (+) Transcript_41886:114-800(+)